MAGMRTMMKLKPQHSAMMTSERQRKMSEARLWGEMRMWRPFRLFGLFAAFMGVCFAIVVIFNKHWLGKKCRPSRSTFLHTHHTFAFSPFLTGLSFLDPFEACPARPAPPYPAASDHPNYLCASDHPNYLCPNLVLPHCIPPCAALPPCPTLLQTRVVLPRLASHTRTRALWLRPWIRPASKSSSSLIQHTSIIILRKSGRI